MGFQVLAQAFLLPGALDFACQLLGNMPDMAQMNAANRAICFALRNPPPGEKKTKLCDIRKIVCKTNGRKPGLSAIQKAATTFQDNNIANFE